MADVRELKDQATRYFAKGRFDKAAAVYGALCEAEPKDLQLRVRLGDALSKAGDRGGAVAAYRAAAEAYARAGFLPRAIAVCKLILELEPEHRATQLALAQLYVKKSAQPTIGARAAAGARVPDAPPIAPLEPAPRAPGGSTSLELPDNDLELDDGTGPAPSWKGAPWEAPGAALAPHASSGDPRAAPARAAPAGASAPLPTSEAPAARAPIPGAVAPSAGSRPGGGRTSWSGVDAAPAQGSPAGTPVPHRAAASAHGSPAPVAPLAVSAARGSPGGAAAAPPPAAASAPPRHAPSTPAPSHPQGEPGATASPSREPAPVPLRFKFTELDLGEPEMALMAARSGPPRDPATQGGASRAPAGATAPPSTLVELQIGQVDDGEIEILTVPADASADVGRLPEIPLFSELSREAFVELASRCALRRCGPGEVVIAEGSAGTSFFVIGSGAVRVCKQRPEGPLELARLGEGAFFGEMALLSEAPRAASVIVEEAAELLEISAPLLAELMQRYPHVGQVLKRFCRERFLANVLAISRVFAQFSGADRRRLFERFQVRAARRGERILEEGRPSDGLYVVLTGAFEVQKSHAGRAARIAELKEGDLFGEISLMTKGPATATVLATSRATILRLPREDFDDLISTYPQILALVSELTDERLRQQQPGAVGVTFL